MSQDERLGNIRGTKIESATYEDDLLASRICEIPSNMQFRADYNGETDGLPLYTGHAAKGLSEGSNGWLLKEYTYDANRQCTKILVAYGDWTNRSTASYS